jgi:serine/threonine-protein kinase
VIGHVIGNYRIVRELGRGGMGMVYGAEHTQLGRPAALKMLLPQMSADTGIVQRFFNEARAASAIDHPGIVEVFDFGTHTDGRAYIVMELLKGESLEARLSRAPMTSGEASNIVAQVAGALAAAHARGIVHRDLKPDNIFLVPNELVAGGTQVKVLDFGIAKLAGEQGGGMKTQTGAVIGTPAYMSPEQCMGRSDIDHRTDLYSLGCVLYHMLTGRPPFLSEHGTGMILAAHMRDPVVDPRSLAPVPEPLAQIATKLLEKEPGARFQTATDLRNALVSAGAAMPPTKPPAALGTADTMAPGQGPVSGYGATAYVTGAATTNSGAAAQAITKPPTLAPAKKKTGLWIGLALVAAAGAGAAAFLAMNGGKKDATAQVTPAQPPAPSPAPASAAVPPPAPAPAAVSAAPTPATLPSPPAQGAVAVPPAPPPTPAACPTGQIRSDDTQGHCCWQDQAWSSARDRCIGKPTCPKGLVVKGESCVDAPVPASTLSPELFTVTKTGNDVTLVFPAPLVAKQGEQYWAAIVAAGKPDSEWGVWAYVPQSARKMTLKAPADPGEYEVRLHGNYPTRSYNVVHRVRIRVD